MRVLIRPLVPGPRPPLPRPRDEVHVWAAPVRGWVASSLELLDVLTADERGRAARYVNRRTSDQFVVARGLLRLLLARYLGLHPVAVPVVLRPDGKPTLDGAAVEFNVSHTDGLVLVAVADRPVGVDVEAVRPMPTMDDLVARFFTPTEAEQYRDLSSEHKLAAFFRGWTCKEAVLKGIGCGARDLDRCVVDLDPSRPARLVGTPDTAARWSVATWEPAAGYAAAVAVAHVGSLDVDVKSA